MLSALVIFFAAAAWGALHSWLASLGLKDRLSRRFGLPAERWYRLIYNIFAVLSLLPVLLLAGMLPDRILYSIPPPWGLLLLALQGAAAVFVLIGVLQTGALSFLGLRQAFAQGGPQQTPRLITGGLYRLVRHPLYLGGLVFIWASPFMTRNLLVLFIAFSLYLVVGAHVEERKLIAEFGEEYARYRRRTPMFCPWPRPASEN
jgi:protein-S-isoprenylcysteine O-methyltransferase Ste14